MAFNPSPKVAAVKDFANKFNKKQVIIFFNRWGTYPTQSAGG
jgi:hypothetical protein